MSGTSVDGVDAVLASFDPLVTHGFVSRPMPAALRAALLELQSSGPDEIERGARAANALADLYVEAVEAVLASTGTPRQAVAAIGAHGQTVRHRPEAGYTVQLLNAARLAERTGLEVVADFRSADVAAGGEGAPLVPAFHAQVFGGAGVRRAIVNLGGIANVTLIADGTVRGCDTGPANTLLDAWSARHLGTAFDDDGAWAAAGTPDDALLATLLADPWFARPAPKSTGQELFNAGWLDARLADHGRAIAPRDVQATLVELTAESVAAQCRAASVDEVAACGGGVRNAALMRALARRLAPARLMSTAALGLDPQAVEATAFAWLAMRRLSGEPGNLPAVTGAAGPRVLGARYPAPPRGKEDDPAPSHGNGSDPAPQRGTGTP